MSRRLLQLVMPVFPDRRMFRLHDSGVDPNAPGAPLPPVGSLISVNREQLWIGSLQEQLDVRVVIEEWDGAPPPIGDTWQEEAKCRLYLRGYLSIDAGAVGKAIHGLRLARGGGGSTGPGHGRTPEGDGPAGWPGGWVIPGPGSAPPTARKLPAGTPSCTTPTATRWPMSSSRPKSSWKAWSGTSSSSGASTYRPGTPVRSAVPAGPAALPGRHPVRGGRPPGWATGPRPGSAFRLPGRRAKPGPLIRGRGPRPRWCPRTARPRAGCCGPTG